MAIAWFRSGVGCVGFDFGMDRDQPQLIVTCSQQIGITKVWSQRTNMCGVSRWDRREFRDIASRKYVAQWV
tara:strand:- start:534 stop:746 length:213 start_codon:yes stop_codon:yes gene_type:complete